MRKSKKKSSPEGYYRVPEVCLQEDGRGRGAKGGKRADSSGYRKEGINGKERKGSPKEEEGKPSTKVSNASPKLKECPLGR